MVIIMLEDKKDWSVFKIKKPLQNTKASGVSFPRSRRVVMNTAKIQKNTNMNSEKAIREKLLAEIASEKRILKNTKILYDIFSSYQYGGDRTDRTEQFVINMIKNSGLSTAIEYINWLNYCIEKTEKKIMELMRKYAQVKYAGKY